MVRFAKWTPSLPCLSQNNNKAAVSNFDHVLLTLQSANVGRPIAP